MVKLLIKVVLKNLERFIYKLLLYRNKMGGGEYDIDDFPKVDWDRREFLKYLFRFLALGLFTCCMSFWAVSKESRKVKEVLANPKGCIELIVEKGDSIWDYCRKYGPDNIDTRMVSYFYEGVCFDNDAGLVVGHKVEEFPVYKKVKGMRDVSENLKERINSFLDERF